MRHEEERRQRDQSDPVHAGAQHSIGGHDQQQEHGLSGRPVAGFFSAGLGQDQRVPNYLQNVVRSEQQEDVHRKEDGARSLAGMNDAEEGQEPLQGVLLSRGIGHGPADRVWAIHSWSRSCGAAVRVVMLLATIPWTHGAADIQASGRFRTARVCGSLS